MRGSGAPTGRCRSSSARRAARYAPGDAATVDVRTRDATGHGVAASVVLRAVDEKLFTMGAASADDPLNELYASVTSGVTGSYATHRAPILGPEGGDTTGGGGDERDDFRDVVLFRMVETDATGHATVSFKVSDDLTSWRVSASAITADLQAGYGSVLVPSGCRSSSMPRSPASTSSRTGRRSRCGSSGRRCRPAIRPRSGSRRRRSGSIADRWPRRRSTRPWCRCRA